MKTATTSNRASKGKTVKINIHARGVKKAWAEPVLTWEEFKRLEKLARSRGMTWRKFLIKAIENLRANHPEIMAKAA